MAIDEWPPDVREVDLDSGFWVTLKEAIYRTHKSESTLRRMARKEGVALMVCGTLWFDLRRIMRPANL